MSDQRLLEGCFFFLLFFMPLSAVISLLEFVDDEAPAAFGSVEGVAIIAEGSEVGAVVVVVLPGVDIGDVGVLADDGGVAPGAVSCATAAVERASAAAVNKIVFIVYLPNRLILNDHLDAAFRD